MPSIHFHNADKAFRFPQKRLLKVAIIDLFAQEGRLLECLNYIFCSDEYLLKINNDFLSHDYYTDIITFPLSEEGQPIVGEIYISLDRIKDNAVANKASMFKETLRVVFHGALHLCGYKDKSKKNSVLMRSKEDYYTGTFHVKWNKA